jgi:hypothetical protein
MLMMGMKMERVRMVAGREMRAMLMMMLRNWPSGLLEGPRRS